MKISNRLFFAVVYFITCLQTLLLADIIEISNLNETSQEFFQLDDNSLVLFDVDYTLLIPNDAILRPGGQLLAKKLEK